MINNLSKKSISRLEKYPVLKFVIEDFIKNDGHDPVPGCVSDLVVYIRELNLDEPSFFGWNEYDSEDFYSWGHNSRYRHVLEPMLTWNLNRHVCKLLDYLDSGVKEPDSLCIKYQKVYEGH